MRLLGVELSRFRSRRAIALLLLLAALMAGAVAAKTIWDTRPLSAADISTAQAQAAMEADQPTVKDELDKCLANPAIYLGPGATAQQCRDTLTPSASSYLVRHPLDLREALHGTGLRVSVFVIGLLVIAGCTFAGSDWSSGSMTNQLVFESRRTRVWSAKALAVALWSGLASLVVIGGFWLALYLAAVARDSPIGTQVQQDIGWHVLRAVVLAIAAAVGGFALTMIFRHTVATLGLLFAYSVGGEIVVNLLPVNGVARWSLGNNVFGWLEKDFSYYDSTVQCTGNCDGMQALGYLGAGLFLLVLLAIAVAASLATFTRRDI